MTETLSQTNSNDPISNENNPPTLTPEQKEQIEYLHSATRVALSNIRNCLKRSTGFTQNSLENFQRHHINDFNIIKEKIPEISSPTDWIKEITNLSSNLKSNTLDKIREEIEKLIKGKAEAVTTTDIKEDEETENELTEESDSEEVEEPKIQNKPEFPQNKPLTISQSNTNINNLFKPTSTRSDTKLNIKNGAISGNQNQNFLTQRTNQNSNYSPLQTNSPTNNILAELTSSLSLNKPSLRIESLSSKYQDVIDWFETFEIQTMRWTDDMRGFEVASYFDNAAREQYKKMDPYKRTNYQEIRKYMIQNFKAHRPINKIMEELYHVGQRPDENIESYSNRISKLIKELPDSFQKITKETLPIIFRDGCSNDIKKILPRDQKSFEKLVREAIEIERDLKTQENFTLAAIKDKDEKKEDSKPIKCYKCDKVGHKAKECRSQPQSRDRRFRDNRENNRNRSRRSISNENRNRSQTPNQRNVRFNTRPFINQETRPICKYCQKIGHEEEKCWIKQGLCGRCGQNGHHFYQCRQINNRNNLN